MLRREAARNDRRRGTRPPAGRRADPWARAAGLDVVGVPVDHDRHSGRPAARRPTRDAVVLTCRRHQKKLAPPGRCCQPENRARPLLRWAIALGRGRDAVVDRGTTTTPSTGTTARLSVRCKGLAPRTTSCMPGRPARRWRRACASAGSCCPVDCTGAIGPLPRITRRSWVRPHWNSWAVGRTSSRVASSIGTCVGMRGRSIGGRARCVAGRAGANGCPRPDGPDGHFPAGLHLVTLACPAGLGRGPAIVAAAATCRGPASTGSGPYRITHSLGRGGLILRLSRRSNEHAIRGRASTSISRGS